MYYRIKLLDKDNINIFIKKIDCYYGRTKESPISLEGIVDFSKKGIKWKLIYTDKKTVLNEILTGFHDFYRDGQYDRIQEVMDECLDERVELTDKEYKGLSKVFDNQSDEYKHSLNVLKEEIEKRKQDLFESYNANVKSLYEYAITNNN